jgi:iron complex transport system permease protein
LKQNRHIKLWALLALVAMSLAVILAGLLTGTYEFGLGDIWRILTGQEVENASIVLDLRLPRVLLAFLTGAILAQGGFFMQTLIKNPLADPYIMGLTAGAGFGVNLFILGILPLPLAAAWGYPFSAALGGLLSLLLVVMMGFGSLKQDNAKLLIAGVAVSAIFMALTSFLIYLYANGDDVRQIVFWTFGNFGKANWHAVQVVMILLLISTLFGWLFARPMDVLLLGDQQAHSLGLSVRNAKLIILLIAAVCVGGTVAFTGPIGFVGMMVPHFSRSLFGSSHRVSMILGGLLGAVFLLACDVASQWLLPPAGLPVGIATAILGVPFFLYLLGKRDSFL